MSKSTSGDKAKLIFLMLYFLLLTVERVISLVAVFTGNIADYDGLEWYMTILTIAAIVGAYVYICVKCPITKKRYENGKVSASPTLTDGVFEQLAIAAGILLLGGMVHTVGTIPPIQFGSYGMILVSMAIHTAQSVKKNGNGLVKWLSFSYIVSFSMSIPVVYHTEIEQKLLFYVIEILTSAGLVILFTIMLYNFYKSDSEGICKFNVLPFAIAVVGDAAVLILRWSEEINFFVLIFICVTAVLYPVGKIAYNKFKG